MTKKWSVLSIVIDGTSQSVDELFVTLLVFRIK